MFYLWHLLDKPDLDSKSLKKLDSIEAIIQLNALCLAFGMEEMDKVDPKILWKYLLNSSLKFPLGLQINYLTRIGFSLEEIQSLLMCDKFVRLSSKNLPFTHEDYIPLMSAQLSEIVKNHDFELPAIDLMEMLTSHDYELNSKNDNEQIEIQ